NIRDQSVRIIRKAIGIFISSDQGLYGPMVIGVYFVLPTRIVYVPVFNIVYKSDRKFVFPGRCGADMDYLHMWCQTVYHEFAGRCTALRSKDIDFIQFQGV